VGMGIGRPRRRKRKQINKNRVFLLPENSVSFLIYHNNVDVFTPHPSKPMVLPPSPQGEGFVFYPKALILSKIFSILS